MTILRHKPGLLIVLLVSALLTGCGPRSSTRTNNEIRLIRILQAQAIQYNRQGLLLVKQRRYGLARGRFTLALMRLHDMKDRCRNVPGFCNYSKLNRNLASALTNRGASHASLRQFRHAMKDANRAIGYSYRYHKAHYLKGLLHLEFGNVEAARKELKILQGFQSRFARKLNHKIQRRQPVSL